MRLYVWTNRFWMFFNASASTSYALLTRKQVQLNRCLLSYFCNAIFGCKQVHIRLLKGNHDSYHVLIIGTYVSTLKKVE